jgi:hypothetical protein
MLGARSSTGAPPARLLGPTWRLGRAAIVVVGLAVAAVVYVVLLATNVPYDTWTYLAAGERLNAGHDLYALGPADRPVHLEPPFWTVPLLSPPLIAVIWRPLALLPADLGLQMWWTGATLALVGVLAVLMARRPLATAALAVALAFPLLTQLYVGNVNPFLLIGLIAIWLLVRQGRDGTAGAILAILVAVKVTPVVLAWWFVVGGRRRALAGFLVAGVVALAVSVAGGGIGAHIAYLDVIRYTTSIGQSAMSLTAVGQAVGLPDPIASSLGIGAVVAGATAAVLLRNRPGPSFAVLVATFVVASPVVTPGSLILLFAALAPLAWPWADQPRVMVAPGPDSAAAHA